MGKDDGLKEFFSDDERYADVVNGLGFGGRQVIRKEDLQDLDTQTGVWRSPRFIRKQYQRQKKRIKYRDVVRKIAMGMNFAVVGIENQDEIDYSMVLRNMVYDVDEYERQAARIRKEVRKNRDGLSRGEYMYGFRKDSTLHPVITFALYYGKEPWDGAKDLYQLLNFQDIPDDLKKLISNYKINLVEIRKIEDTSVFQTDVKQVFDFIRCSEDSEKLKELVEHDPAYQSMEEDAFDLVVHYTASKELVQVKDYYTKGGSVDMCRALTELIAQGRAEGKAEGKAEALRALVETCREFGVTYEDALERIMDKLSMSEEEAEACLDRYWK